MPAFTPYQPPNMSTINGPAYAFPPTPAAPTLTLPVNKPKPAYVPPKPTSPTILTGPTSDAGFRATDATASGSAIGLAQAFQRAYPGTNPDAALGSVAIRGTSPTVAAPTPTPVAPPPTGTSSNAGKPGYDKYGNPSGSAEAIAAWMKEQEQGPAGVGTSPGTEVTTGGFVAPGSGIDTRIEQYLPTVMTPEQLQAEVAARAVGINKKYDLEAADIEQQIKDQNASDFSALAGVGTGINPLSSAGQSVSSKNSSLRDKYLSNLEQRRTAELDQSKAGVLGVNDKALGSWRDELDRQRQNQYDVAKQQYTASQDAFQNSITKLNAYVAMTKDQRDTSTSEKNDAQQNIQTLLTQFGSGAFDGVSDEDLSALEKAAGMPAGSLKTGLKTLKETEISNKAAAAVPDLKFVPGGKYQSSGYFDPTSGKFVSLGGGGGAGGGGGGGGYSSGLEQEAADAYFRSMGNYPTKQQLPFVVGTYKSYGGGSMSMDSSPTTGPFAAGSQARYKFDPVFALINSLFERTGRISVPPAVAPASTDGEDVFSVRDSIDAARSGL